MYFWVNGSSADISGTGTSALSINTGNYVTAYGSFRAPIFYDSDNTAYYTDPASTSIMNRIDYTNLYYAANTAYGFVGSNVYADTINSGVVGDQLELCFYSGTYTTTSGSMRAPLFYDRDNTGYYTDPASTSVLNNVQVTTFGVGTAASGTTGEIRATNNVTAYYSDERLKENITTISSALSKLLTLRGVTFNSNEIAEQYGYTDKKEQVGVIAQDVEKVLPQVVVPAPFDIAQDEDGNEYSKSGENYKTVHYDKLVPLLIEAIKELKGEIEELKSKIPV
jgi:hypothetical protein